MKYFLSPIRSPSTFKYARQTSKIFLGGFRDKKIVFFHNILYALRRMIIKPTSPTASYPHIIFPFLPKRFLAKTDV